MNTRSFLTRLADVEDITTVRTSDVISGIAHQWYFAARRTDLAIFDQINEHSHGGGAEPRAKLAPDAEPAGFSGESAQDETDQPQLCLR
jgi:hypothetical protein